MEAGLSEARRILDGDAAQKTVWVAFDSHALWDRLRSRLGDDEASAGSILHLHHICRQHKVFVIWVPGHAGLPLNERADEAARRGGELPQDNIKMPGAVAKARLRKFVRVTVRDVYARNVPPEHLHRRATGGEALPPDPTRSRQHDVLLRHLRLNRAPFLRATIHRWGKVDTPTCPHCNEEPEDTEHFLLRCPRWAALRAEVFGPSPTLHDVLHTSASRAIDFVNRAGFGLPYAERRDQ